MTTLAHQFTVAGVRAERHHWICVTASLPVECRLVEAQRIRRRMGVFASAAEAHNDPGLQREVKGLLELVSSRTGSDSCTGTIPVAVGKVRSGPLS